MFRLAQDSGELFDPRFPVEKKLPSVFLYKQPDKSEMEDLKCTSPLSHTRCYFLVLKYELYMNFCHLLTFVCLDTNTLELHV